MPGGRIVDADGEDITERIAEGASLMSKIGANPMTVSELASKIAGLPPMMEVFANADGTSMFINDLVIEQASPETPPYGRLHCSVTPQIKEAPPMNKDELEARQRQRAMALSASIEAASRMHTMVE